MRIIAGQFRGRTIRAPKGDLTRPTADRTRESIFNLLQSRIELEGARILDLFAGSGALGLEALSRGAASVVFVETSAAALSVCRQNAATLDVERHGQFLRTDVDTFIDRETKARFDVVFADPPYELPGLPQLPERVFPLLNPSGLFVLEHDARHSFAHHPALDTSRAYGRTIVTIFDPELSEDA